jgi:hypothetical protein
MLYCAMSRVLGSGNEEFQTWMSAEQDYLTPRGGFTLVKVTNSDLPAIW